MVVPVRRAEGLAESSGDFERLLDAQTVQEGYDLRPLIRLDWTVSEEQF